jgi:hypothetical protein
MGRDHRGARYDLGSSGHASLEVGSPEVLYVAPVAARWPSPRIPCPACFHARPPASRRATVPLNQLSSRFILRWRSPSSEFLRSNLPPAPFDAGSPTQGLVPHRGITGARPRLAKVARPSLRSVLRFSQPLDGFLRPPASQACFIPRATSRVVAVQGLLSPRSRAPSSGAASSLPLSSEPSPAARRLAHAFRRPPDATPWTPRLRGLHPREAALHGVRMSSSPQPAPLFGFHLLQVLNHRLDPGSPGPPLTAFDALSVFQRRARCPVSRETNLPETFEPSD